MNFKGQFKWEILGEVADNVGLIVNSFVEIGVYYGDASKQFRAAWPECDLYLVDPWMRYTEYGQDGGNVWANDVEEGYKTVLKTFEGDSKTHIMRCTSTDAAAKIPPNLDIVFIDGNHSYQYVSTDIRTWLPKIRSGGLLCGHDYERHGDALGVRKAVMDCLGSNHIKTGVDRDDVWIYCVE